MLSTLNGMADSAGTLPTGSSGSPTDFLRNVVGQKVVVRLNSGVDYRGACLCGACDSIQADSGPVSISYSPTVAQSSIFHLDGFHHLPGILSCLDGYMNAALENTEEVVNGKVTNNYGDAFVRGNNSRFSLSYSPAVEFGWS